MKQLSYTMLVKYKGDPDTKAWSETNTEWVEDSVTAQQDAERILKRFNSSRREAEKERQLVKAWEVADADQPLKHQWGKLSLVTEKGGFDRMQCEICGVTGKRYSLGGNVQIDAKYKKKYEHMCPAKRIN